MPILRRNIKNVKQFPQIPVSIKTSFCCLYLFSFLLQIYWFLLDIWLPDILLKFIFGQWHLTQYLPQTVIKHPSTGTAKKSYITWIAQGQRKSNLSFSSMVMGTLCLQQKSSVSKNLDLLFSNYCEKKVSRYFFIKCNFPQ